MNIRRLGPGDEGVVANLATRPPQTALFGDERTLFLVAFDGERPMGFVLAHELPRRHGDPSNLLVYEVDVAEVYRRRGVGKALLDDLATLARRRGIREGWVLTDEDDHAAMALYRSAGGLLPQQVTMWEFRYADG
jgi:ribosomal protein S18 acetylase RimI-like enzyme